MNDKLAGLEHRYNVERVFDMEGKHDECRFFVLDPQHDPIARTALAHYALAARIDGYEALYQDLWKWLADLEEPRNVYQPRNQISDRREPR